MIASSSISDAGSWSQLSDASTWSEHEDVAAGPSSLHEHAALPLWQTELERKLLARVMRGCPCQTAMDHFQFFQTADAFQQLVRMHVELAEICREERQAFYYELVRGRPNILKQPVCSRGWVQLLMTSPQRVVKNSRHAKLGFHTPPPDQRLPWAHLCFPISFISCCLQVTLLSVHAHTQ